MDAKDIVVGESYFLNQGDFKAEVLFIDERSDTAFVMLDDNYADVAAIADLSVEREKIFSVRANVTHTDSQWVYRAEDKEEAIEKYMGDFKNIYGEDATYAIIDVKEVDDSQWDDESEGEDG